MRKCKHTKPDGSKCKATPIAGRPYCFFHDPERADQRKKAQASGGERRERKGVKPEPKAKPKDDGEGTGGLDMLELELIEGATLDDDRLEALLATAIMRGVAGQLAAPVLANITKLIGVYEKFLDRKRDRGDAELARKMTNAELHAALLEHVPLEVLQAEIKRRQNGRDETRGAQAATEEDHPTGHEPAGVEGGPAGAEMDDGHGVEPAATGDQPPAEGDAGQCDRPPANQPVREGGAASNGGDPATRVPKNVTWRL